MRFILALLPPEDTLQSMILTAQALFFPISEGYLLSEESLPHITLCQFECESEDEAKTVWTQSSKMPSEIVPYLMGISFIKKQALYQVEISVKRDAKLIEMHLMAKDIIENLGFSGLTESGDLYRPHITLAQIHLPEHLPKWPDDLFSEAPPFKLALGRGNSLGQYLYTIAN